MTENIKKLLELASSNEELKNRINNASKDEIIAIAKENGISLADADFEQSREISDDELDTVAGGKKCTCVAGGSGKADAECAKCICVGGGGGEWADGDVRCVCVLAGYGTSVFY